MGARENILEKITQALAKPTERVIAKPNFTRPIYQPHEETDWVVAFAQEFSKAKVELYFCENLEHFLADLKQFVLQRNLAQIYVFEPYLQQLCSIAAIVYKPDNQNFNAIEASITLCEGLIARTGSILVTANQTRSLTIYPPLHIVVGFTAQVSPDIATALANIQEQYKNNSPSLISIISGPSQTADIEKTLVLGAHGPKELVLFLIDE